MPLSKIQFKPGINREVTSYAGEGGYYDCDKIRFRSSMPQKIGGWVQMSILSFQGICRSLWNWIDLEGTNYLGVGTNLKYYIEKGGAFYDITPIRLTVSPMLGPQPPATGNPFSTNVASPHTVTVTDLNNEATLNDFVTFSGATGPVGGIPASVLNAEHQITKIITASSYEFTVSQTVTSTASGGGAAVVAAYQINVGNALYTAGNGWGAGFWGRDTWGSATKLSAGSQMRLWSNDNYGEDLIIAPREGAIYIWQDAFGPETRAKALSAVSTALGYAGQFVPKITYQVISSSIQRFVITMGSNTYNPGNANTPFDRMLVRWSDQENPYDWVPSATNQAGEYRLNNGSYIVCARNTRQEILVWTDAALYSMQYLGPPYVWGFQLIQDNTSIMGPNTAITANNVTYWMGRDRFYVYGGRVEPLPCTVRQYIFDRLDKDQAGQCFAGSNQRYGEIWWFYVSKQSPDKLIDSYVIYNYLENIWYYGNLSRTAWLESGIRDYPMAADPSVSRIMNHEASIDNEANDIPIPIEAFIQSSDFDIDQGDKFGFVWRILPDLTFAGSTSSAPSVNMTVRPRVNSGSPYSAAPDPTVTEGVTYPVEEYTGQVYTRIRGRQMAFKISSKELGVNWQLGTPRLDIRPDGRR